MTRTPATSFAVRPGSADDASAESFPASDPPAASEGMTSVGEPDTQESPGAGARPVSIERRRCPVTLTDGTETEVADGHVVIAAITSCTNTSNPSVMIGAGLLARNAVARGLTVPPWVKTSLAPGSFVVTDYYERAGLLDPLAQLGFQVVGYGCTTCIGNSGPLDAEISRIVTESDLSVCSVLSGNRNFEGRIHPGLPDELPRVAAARRRLRARGHDGHRHAQRPARDVRRR